ncbi:MAG: hypothetical protein WBC51_05945 [Vicinamibacterales bacterium]
MNKMERDDEGISLEAGDGQPLIGVVGFEGGRESVCYFSSEEDADRAIPVSATREALALASAWSDLDWGELEPGLDRIRHGSNQRRRP